MMGGYGDMYGGGYGGMSDMMGGMMGGMGGMMGGMGGGMGYGGYGYGQNEPAHTELTDMVRLHWSCIQPGKHEASGERIFWDKGGASIVDNYGRVIS